MDWNTLLRERGDEAYRVTDKLLDQVEQKGLDWKPTTGENWMTVGQLCQHLTESCGMVARGFVTGNWDFEAPPEGAPDGSMLPSAEQMKAVASLSECRKKLKEDQKVFHSALTEAADRLATEKLPAPWNPNPKLLGEQLLDCISHLELHKAQLFYYLKLQNKSVNTEHLWGV